MNSAGYLLQLRQKLTMIQNRYEVVRIESGGESVLAYATQKRFTLKEKVTFTDETGEVAFTLGARNVFEVRGTYDVTGADGAVLATVSKDFGASLLRSTYTVEGPGWQLVGQERGPVKAALRRVIGAVSDIPWPFPIQFDFTDPTGRSVVSIDRQALKVRDRYDIQVHEPRFDWRVAAALGVTVDAFMNR